MGYVGKWLCKWDYGICIGDVFVQQCFPNMIEFVQGIDKDISISI